MTRVATHPGKTKHGGCLGRRGSPARRWEGSKATAAKQKRSRTALEAIKLQPHFPGAYYHLGRGLLAMGRNEEARVAFETMVEQDPDVGTSYLAMAQYYLAVGEYQQALASLEGDSARDTIINRYYTAAAQAAMGRSDEALATLATILEMGFRDFDKLEASPCFESLRDNPGFKELIDLYRD